MSRKRNKGISNRLTHTQETVLGLIISALIMLAVFLIKDYMQVQFKYVQFVGLDPQLGMIIVIVMIIAVLAYFGIIKERPSVR